MTTVRFTVPGQPSGYYASGARPNWTRLKRYIAWRTLVQFWALHAGLGPCPLRPTEAAPIRIDVVAYYRDRRPHSDPENTRKGVVDALTWAPKGQKKGDDRWCHGSHALPRYDAENPRTEVEVTW